MIDEYGGVVAGMFFTHSNVEETVNCIADAARAALTKQHHKRTDFDMCLLAAVTKSSSLIVKHCGSWSVYKKVDLCRFMEYRRFQSLDKIFQASSHGTVAYILISGVVRSLKPTEGTNSMGERRWTCVEELKPGDVSICSCA